MRCYGWVALGILGLIVLHGVRTGGSEASRQAGGKPPAGARPIDRGDDVVDGYGPTAAAARERALEHAQARVETLLRERFGGWHPGAEQLDPAILLATGVVQARGETEVEPRFKEEKVFVARYKVELTPEYLTRVQQVARLERVESRHLLLARLLVAVVAVLLVSAGYLRLEEMTRGYATHLLRAAAALVLALVGVGLWLTR